MSIKSGELIHVGNQVLIDRAQSAGPGSLNIPTEKIYELGNYQSVAIIRDTPDLSFSLDSLDVSAEIESILTGQDFTSMADGTALDLSTCKTIDVASQFKAGKSATNPFDITGSSAIPFLSPEQISYKFGLHDNATQTISLKGDSIYWALGTAYTEVFTGTGVAAQTCLLAHTVLPYNGDTIAGTKYALSVSLANAQRRLVLGTDYTETITGAGAGKTVTVHITAAVAATEQIRISYQSDVVGNYPQASHAAASTTRPAAIRGRDIEVRVGGVTLTDRWSSVQTATADWRVQLQKDEEFGNYAAVSQDYDTAAVTGTIEIKPRDVAELMARMRTISGVTVTTEVIGTSQAVPLPLEIILHSPTDGSALKTLYVPDARFTMPSFSGRVQQKLTVPFAYESDGGTLIVYKGLKP